MEQVGLKVGDLVRDDANSHVVDLDIEPAEAIHYYCLIVLARKLIGSNLPWYC